MQRIALQMIPIQSIAIQSIHPGITLEQVQEATGFDLHVPAEVSVTPAPTEDQLSIIRELDPQDWRSKQLKDNPPGDRS